MFVTSSEHNYRNNIYFIVFNFTFVLDSMTEFSANTVTELEIFLSVL